MTIELSFIGAVLGAVLAVVVLYAVIRLAVTHALRSVARDIPGGDQVTDAEDGSAER